MASFKSSDRNPEPEADRLWQRFRSVSFSGAEGGAGRNATGPQEVE